MQWVFDYSQSTGNDRLVLLMIADEADDQGANAYPSMERIARRALVSTRTVMRSVARLEAEGELLVERPEMNGRGRFNRYVLVMGRPLDELDGLFGKGDKLSRGRRGEKARIGDTAVSHDPLTLEGSPSSTSSPTVDPSSDAAALCELLADLVEANGSRRPTVSNAWLVEADRMLRLDGRDPAKAERLLRWCQADPFWKGNVLSMSTFRRQYDRLRLRAEEERVKRAGGGTVRRVDVDRDRPSGVVEL